MVYLMPVTFVFLVLSCKDQHLIWMIWSSLKLTWKKTYWGLFPLLIVCPNLWNYLVSTPLISFAACADLNMSSTYFTSQLIALFCKSENKSSFFQIEDSPDIMCICLTCLGMLNLPFFSFFLFCDKYAFY